MIPTTTTVVDEVTAGLVSDYDAADSPPYSALPAVRSRAEALRVCVRRLRRRYHALPVCRRPALDAGSCYGATLAEVSLLGRYGLWPLPPRAVEAIRRNPAAHGRRASVRLSRLNRAVAELDATLAELLRATGRVPA
jgi:hypothetical protein